MNAPRKPEIISDEHAQPLIHEINETGRKVVKNMFLNNADFETYSKIFDDKANSGSEIHSCMLDDEEIAEAMTLVNMIEDAERERRYLHEAASKLARIKLGAMKCISDAEAAIKNKDQPGLDAAHKLYVGAANSYSDLIELHKQALKEAQREAFKARLAALTTGIQLIGDGILKIGKYIRSISSSMMSVWQRDTLRINETLEDESSGSDVSEANEDASPVHFKQKM